MQLFVSLFLLLLSAVSMADLRSVHCPLGCPLSPVQNDLIFGHLYAASNNPDTKFADWVAYEVNVTNFGPSPGRNWASDPLLDDADTLEESDYKNASNQIGIDRGHQAPLASFAGSRYWSELNYLSNITPQSKNLNQGAWKDLEAAVRDLAKYGRSFYVITGPLYERGMPPLPEADEPHKVPSGYFKIIYLENGESISFIMDQGTNRNATFCSNRSSLSNVKNRAGVDVKALRESENLKSEFGCL